MSDITNTSYCSKDFGSLYPEVLDLAKRITNSWDPASSNESDPGVVLLKEAAFIGDHNNFNIDKNTLENFLPTATQDKSVRNIVEMNGYTPEYYISATGKVSFNYTIPEDSAEEVKTFTIPALSLVISDVNENITYTQISDLPIIYDDSTSATNRRSSTQSCDFIQGTRQTLSVNNSTTILTENLDDNNRIYFPEISVAQNGIYIRYADETLHKEYDYWTRNNYLLTQPLGSRIYKVDFDSDKGFPYVEFPQDISNIIESGLIIYYFTSAGEVGNVSANTLVNIVSPTVVTDREGVEHDAANFTLTNVSAITNGRNPETITEMYNSFKKVVGTFNTLVTRDDYANRIYKLTDELDNYLISNVFVTDRRNDINRSANIMTADKNGAYLENIGLQPNQLIYKGVVQSLPAPTEISVYPKGSLVTLVETTSERTTYTLYCNMASSLCDWEECNTINLNDFAILSDVMTPYDLIIYALKTFSMTDYSSSAQYKALENAYTAADESTRREIEEAIDNDKCINHVFKSPVETNTSNQNDVFCYKNYAPLNITITPYYKITTEIKNSIIDNIYRTISENFNPRTLNWGEALDTLEIKNVIINCDDRIRDVDITPIQYKTKVLKTSSVTGGASVVTEEDLISGSNGAYLLDLVSKNILAGRMCLFTFDDRFSLNYNQVDGDTYNKIYDLNTEVKIKINSQPVNDTFTYIEGESFVNEIELKTTHETGKGNWYSLVSNGKNIYNTNEYTLAWDDDTNSGESFSIAYDCTEEVASLSMTTYTSTRDVRYTISYTGDAAYIAHTEGTAIAQLNNVETITIKETHYSRSLADAVTSVNYTLHGNEAVQIISPSYYSDTTYSTYVNYRYEDSNGITIKAETDHELTAGQKITLVYTKDGIEQQKQLTYPTVVKTSFDLVPTDLASNTIKRTYTDATGTHQNANFKSLTSSQTISTRQKMKTVLTSTALRCYWNINSTTGKNKLFEDGLNERILENNDFFVYTNDAMNEMVLFGAGTKLVKSANDDNNWLIEEATSRITLNGITTNGIQNDIPWQSINLSGKPLSIIEMNVITLGENDNIKITGWTYNPSSDDDYFINNDWKECTGNIIYTSNGTTVALPALNSVDDNYLIKSRLDIVSSADTPQELYCGGPMDDSEYTDGVQTIKFYCEGVNGQVTISADPTRHITFQTSKPLSLIGGRYIDISLLGDISVYSYNRETTPPSGFGEGGNDPTINQTVIIDYSTDAAGFIKSDSEGVYYYKGVYQFYYDHSVNDPREWLIPIRIDGNAGVKVTAKMYYKNGSTPTVMNFKEYGKTETITEKVLTGNDLYFLSPVGTIPQSSEIEDTLYLVLSWEVSHAMTESEIINVFDLRVTNGVNSFISKKETITLNNLNARMNQIISGSDKPNTKYYYTYNINDGVHLNLDTYCTKSDSDASGYSALAFDNPSIMFDPANIAAEKTIAQIDIRNSTINIKSEMLKG